MVASHFIKSAPSMRWFTGVEGFEPLLHQIKVKKSALAGNRPVLANVSLSTRSVEMPNACCRRAGAMADLSAASLSATMS
jgi:hypothetical protein